MSNLFIYSSSLAMKAGKTFVSGGVFAKVLAPNDDSGKHGVVIPSEAYHFFPHLPLPDPTCNATALLKVFDSVSRVQATVAYKYYQRYPERRLTRLPGLLNDRNSGRRLIVFLHAKHEDGSSAYYVDCANAAPDGRFRELYHLVFGDDPDLAPERFVIRPVDSTRFRLDSALAELLQKFDQVRSLDWIETLRTGDTGIGYTFETLLGIEENNDQTADFRGIEIKCKGLREGQIAGTGKINLFQSGPKWALKSTAKERIRLLGKQGTNGLYTCNSQVSTKANNRGVLLRVLTADGKIDLQKMTEAMGYWPFAQLEQRLIEKHSRAVFVKADVRRSKTKTEYKYQELVYCDRPSIHHFVDLVSRRRIVFEFLMSEKPNGTVRNRGYPWRLIREEFLSQLFAFQIKLR